MLNLHQLSTNDLDLIRDNPYKEKFKNFGDLRESHLGDTPQYRKQNKSMVEFETNMVTKMFENNSPTNEKMQEKEQEIISVKHQLDIYRSQNDNIKLENIQY